MKMNFEINVVEQIIASKYSPKSKTLRLGKNARRRNNINFLGILTEEKLANITETKDCRISEELLQDYIDASLNEASKDRVEEHLASCPRCQTIVNETRFLLAATKDLALSEKNSKIQADVKCRFMNKLNTELGTNLSIKTTSKD